MRILFTTQATLSHLFPLLPLAEALAASGHAVAFACARPFCPSVEASGFEAIPAGMEFHGPRDRAAVPRPREANDGAAGSAAPAGRTPTSVLRDVFAGATARAMVPDLLEVCRAWKPDALVRDPQEFGGCVAAEVLGLPHASGRENRFLSPERWAALVGEPLGALRRDHGLPPDPQLTMLYRYLGLAWVPPRFIQAVPLPPDVAFGTHVAPAMHFLRPTQPPLAPGERLPDDLAAWLSGLPDRPTVYATLGVVWNSAPGAFEAILDALRDEPVNLLLTVGQDLDPDAFGPQPAHVRVERFVPQALLAGHVDLVVTAGGFGTTMATLDEGVPMVVLPIGADQPFNAQRCAALGVAEVVPPEARTPDAIRAAVRRVLDDPAYAGRARAFREEMHALPGTEHGVALVERLARQPSPISGTGASGT